MKAQNWENLKNKMEELSEMQPQKELWGEEDMNSDANLVLCQLSSVLDEEANELKT